MSTNQHQQNSKKKVKPTPVLETMAMSGSKGNREAQAKAGGGRSETKNTRRANEEEKLEAMVESRVKERTVGLEMALRQVAEREREEDHARFQEQYKRELRSEFDEKLAKQVDLWEKGIASQERKAAEEAIARQRPNRPIPSNTAKRVVAPSHRSSASQQSGVGSTTKPVVTASAAKEFKEFRLPRESVSVLRSMSPLAAGNASYAEATLQGKRRNEMSTVPSDTDEDDESRSRASRKSGAPRNGPWHLRRGGRGRSRRPEPHTGVEHCGAPPSKAHMLFCPADQGAWAVVPRRSRSTPPPP